MVYDPFKHHRRSVRLKGHDYSQVGTYFITLVTHERECLFGEIERGEMHLNGMGMVAEECWNQSVDHFPNVVLDHFIFMPNHLHAVLMIQWAGEMGTERGRGTACRAPCASS